MTLLQLSSAGTSSTGTTSTPGSQIVGTDIFRFLASRSPGKVSSEYKSRVRSALKVGNAISMDLTLYTRRGMVPGSERFAVHWTPLKNDDGVVAFVVVTLGCLRG